jgi:hypothetical protein
MRWQDIPSFPHINYHINVPWNHLKQNLDHYIKDYNLDMSPDFQRPHVWTEAQQIAYVEFMLRNPQSGKYIYFNHPGWMKSSMMDGQMLLIDGKQRITAALKFLDNEIPAYGVYYKDFTGFKHIPTDIDFEFNVMTMQTRKEILQWYIDFNSGGTIHKPSEIQKVRDLLLEEENK